MSSEKNKYLVSLDGYRGLAILLVFLIHVRLLPLGWIGVPMFLVLSGYLWTKSLLCQKTAHQKKRTNLLQPYLNRLKRIAPSYLFYLGFCAMLFAAISIPQGFVLYWDSLLSLTYNFKRMAPGFVDTDYFGHLWYICVSEQLFLIWPMLIWYIPRGKLVKTFLVLLACGPLIRLGTGLLLEGIAFDSAMASKAVINFPLSHIDSLAWGSLVACISHETPPRWLKNLRTWFALSIIATVTSGLLYAYHLERNMLPPSWKSLGFEYGMSYCYQYVWGWSIISFCCFLLILEVIYDPAFARLFQQKPLIFLGKISFGFYIWHLPILSMVSGVWNPSPHSLSGLAKTFLVLSLSVIVGSLVHSIIEKRCGQWLSKRTLKNS